MRLFGRPDSLTTETPSTEIREIAPVADYAPLRSYARNAARASRALVHISGTDVPDCFCLLVGIDAGTLFVRSERQIPTSTPIVVAFDHIRLAGVVANCQPTDADWVISVALGSCRRRLEDRVPVGERSVVGIVGPDGTTVVHGTVIDQSSAGLGIRLERSLDTGTRVCVETETLMVFGEVRYCRATADGHFIAGVMIVEVAPDLDSQSAFSVMLHNLRWRLASTIRGHEVPAYRQ